MSKFKSNIKAIKKKKDHEIDFSDQREVLDDNFWNTAKVVQAEEKSERLSIRIKPSLKKWYKENYHQYQVFIHDILVSFKKSQEFKAHKH